LAFNITGFAQCFAQLCPKGIDISIAYDERTNSVHLHLLRTRRERPRSRAAEQRDERASFHSITSSARASRFGGTSMPSARAVGRLMTSSNLLDCTTGKSAGLAPLRMHLRKDAATGAAGRS
jgi:hypothetical protein